MIRIRTAIAAAVIASGLATVTSAQALTDFEVARNKKLGEICYGIPGNITNCLNNGVDISNRLWKMQSARPFEDSPKSYNPDYKGPPLPPFPSCQFALAACPIDQPCSWRQQVEELIQKSAPCEFPD